MPLMLIPRHSACDARVIAGHVLTVTEALSGRMQFFNERGLTRGIEGNRLTRVPFLKVCLKGSFEVLRRPVAETEELAMERWTRSQIQSGDVALFAPNSFVTVVFGEPCEFLRVTFEADGILVGLERVERLIEKAEQSPVGSLKATWLGRQMRQPGLGLLEGLLLDRKRRSQHQIAALRCLLYELADDLQAVDAPTIQNEREAAVILRYLGDQCHRPINRKAVAEALNVSPGHLGRLVKNFTGISFQAYLTRLRMEQASWLLRQSGLSVEEIALRSGYTSGNYFTQAFRRRFGLSPSMWRRVERQAAAQTADVPKV